jgi:hypothetical protein
MFGKPTWFRPKAIGWGLVPISWQGWLYTAAWGSAIAGPFVLLVTRHQPLEATAWMGLSIGALVYDVAQILRVMRGPTSKIGVTATTASAKRDDNVLYIMDSRPGQPVVTKNYCLHART